MADNVAITAGSGTTIAADEVTDGTLGSVKVQYVKLMDGTLDGTTKATVGSNGLKVDGSGVTQPVSAASLPLPTGAATSAKQAALGTAGSASSDVLTVQGIASMTPIKTDGSGVTQPVSGTLTANAGTNLNTSALALESGGNLAAIATNTGNAATPTRTDIVSSATSVTVVSSNSSRKGLMITNDSTQILYLLFGSGAASATNYTVQMPPGAYYEAPFRYSGQVNGIWASANGNARVTELS